MSREFTTPDPGEGIHEVEIVDVYVSEGDDVDEGDALMAVESDKATIDVPASFTGRIDSVEVAEGDVVEVGSVLLTYSADGAGRNGGQAGDSSAESDEETDHEKSDEDTDDSREREDRKGKDRKEKDKEGRGRKGKSKSASKRKERKRRKAETGDKRETDTGGDEEPSGKDRTERPAGHEVEASPATRRLARELEVALADVAGSGPGGRVLGRDVRNAARRRSRGREPAAGPPLPDFSRWGEISREPLRGVRRATARRMSRSWETIPHVTHTRLADVTDLEAFRRGHVGDLDAKLTLTVLVVKALAAALRRFPRFNASLDTQADEIVYKHYCHIGVAVATDHGLLVPVLRDADRKTLRDLAGELETLSERARERRLTGDEMRGGSISVTNVGGVGGDHFTPIINHPEAAILGIGAMREVPVLVRDGDQAPPRIEARLQLPLIVGFDHRINDGMDAAGFANAIAGPLGDPERLLLDA